MVAQGSQFSLNDVEVVVATVDIQEVRAHRSYSSRSLQAAQSKPYERIRVNVRLSGEEEDHEMRVSRGGEFKYHSPEEEISSVFSFLLLLSFAFCFY